MPETHDAVVIGAGFGGLSAALSLSERGHRVHLCETLNYPGGCASTFSREGDRYEAGATLFAGLDRDQFFGRWMGRHGVDLPVTFPDPVVELRTPLWRLSVDADRDRFAARLMDMAGAPIEGLKRWFALQARVSDTLWPVLGDPSRLPPLSADALRWHLARSPSYALLTPWVGRTTLDVLRSMGLESFEPLRLWLSATCQITVQCPVEEAEALMAIATADYFFRKAGHVHGGIGVLANSMLTAIEGQGGSVSLADRAKSLRWCSKSRLWTVKTRRHTLRSRVVIANLLPEALAGLMEPDDLPRRLRRLSREVATGWGAAMLYLAVNPAALRRPEAHHLELVDDVTAPLHSGNHIFCSVSAASETDRSQDGARTVTVSTHMPLPAAGLPSEAEVCAVHRRMRTTLQRLAPDLYDGVVRQLSASPRTWQRFTGRPQGRVGGVPRRAGLLGYAKMSNPALASGLWLVGDSVFPGQSTLATALGGARVAKQAHRWLRRQPTPLAHEQEAARPSATPG